MSEKKPALSDTVYSSSFDHLIETIKIAKIYIFVCVCLNDGSSPIVTPGIWSL